MGLGLKARLHRGPRNRSPILTLTPTHRQPQGSPQWTAGSSGSPPRAAPRSGSLLERHRGEEKHTRAYEKLPLELQDDGSDSRSPCVNLQLSIHDRHSFGYKRGRASHSRQKGPHCERPLTQQELLREAKITEELNLRSLETYERLEADKKKQVHKKRKCPGPIITYHSVTVPLVGEPGPKEENVDVEGLDPTPTASALTPHAGTGPVVSPPRCLHTFIIFSDDATFEEWFSPRPAPKGPCSGGLPRDPSPSPVPGPCHRHPLHHCSSLQDHP
ncbi:vacuolar protein sorting-associated protein 72 homolog [Canis lupus dingo]|uniref:vacuolar protein sorting-associated protein 72 homolog n=1 Tax=Canis lupus dingo TaxID=286419 RepID=UPI0020C242AE|nr:vacuolar protein sorting-associated protein 72 homolog [Canis lupus dingo]